MEILRIEDLSFTYPETQDKALDGISFTVDKGQFIVICGSSGCGKTTLLRLIKKELAPHGEMSGKIYIDNRPQEELDDRTLAADIGFVMQNPENQIVTDKVWHELAFGLENLGEQTSVIRRRVGEMASYFGIQDWFRKATDQLSGGQKQLLNLASVMVMQPRLLILDEPTGQLDPIAAADFIATLQKLNRELGVTIIIAEHRLEEVFPIADKVIVMDKAVISACAGPREIAGILEDISHDHPMLAGLPSAVRIFAMTGGKGKCPLTVREGRDHIESNFKPVSESKEEEISQTVGKTVGAELKNVWFRYGRDEPDILRGLSLKAYKGELLCILGGNGTGKTTALNVISGLKKAYRGKILIGGRKISDYKGNSLYRGMLALLPQDPQTVFVRDSVRADMEELLADAAKGERERLVAQTAKKLGISHLLDKHPYDLSGGEQQKCALAKILLSQPQILLIDEPTKGLDAASKAELRELLRNMKQEGRTIIMVTHDVEFAAECADRCGLFFDGEIISEDSAKKFFALNNFYTTAANRIARGVYPDAVTCADVAEYCKKSKGENV